MVRLFYCTLLLCSSCLPLCAQQLLHGVVVDKLTNTPVAGATLEGLHSRQTAISDQSGKFTLRGEGVADSIRISMTGYKTRLLRVSGTVMNIGLEASFANLNEVIVSANRELQRRSEAPVAVQVLSKTTINDTKATRLDMLLNKVPGVFMVDLGNEQHSMSIRQPLGYNNVFLYLEDGIPIRTIGDFNHNALIEINQSALERIEVIKGPASSLYGSEAVGGAINFISQAPSQLPTAKIQAELGSLGYRRTDFFVSNTVKKLGLYAGGYYANQNQSANLHNDFSKTAIKLRADYTFNAATKLVTTFDYIKYKTDQKGGLDSAHFYGKDYSSIYRFTYRAVDALRVKSTLTHDWDAANKTSATVFFRNTAIGQNPFYYIARVTGNPGKATGQINRDAFNSYGAVIQHSKKFRNLQARLIAGVSADISPATYVANFIDVNQDVAGTYDRYSRTDSLLTDYQADLLNTAVYAQFEINPVNQLKLVAAARYDRMDYRFDNHLPSNAYSGAPDTKNAYDRFTPKIGITYDLRNNRGIYANYSVGFAPPNITDLYSGVKVPTLQPSSYSNYELGGWMALAGERAYGELSIYQMNGTNEIVSVRLNDGTYQNQNAGATRHRGIEASLKYTPVKDLFIRIGGTFAEHKYVHYNTQDKNYSGNTMSQAPKFIANAEATYKPAFAPGLRLALEWQGLGKYFTDAANTASYQGFNLLNARVGYSIHNIELWANCINLGDIVYATTVEKSDYGTTYRPGQLRTLNVGVGYLFNKRK